MSDETTYEIDETIRYTYRVQASDEEEAYEKVHDEGTWEKRTLRDSTTTDIRKYHE